MRSIFSYVPRLICKHKFCRLLTKMRYNSPMTGFRYQTPSLFGSKWLRTSYIQVFECPNPNSLKFIPGIDILGNSNTVYFSNKTEAISVESVLFGVDFITISKAENSDWLTLKPQIFATVIDFLKSGKPILSDSADDNIISEDSDTDLVKQIKELLKDKIRPIVQEDGGDIVFHSFDESSGILRLTLQVGLVFIKGSCSNCPKSSNTLKMGVENMMKFYIPEVKEVEEVVDENTEASDRIFRELEKKLRRIKNIDDIKKDD